MMTRPANRRQIRRLRKAQLSGPCIRGDTTAEVSIQSNINNKDTDDIDNSDDVDDSLPGAYAISNKRMNDSNEIQSPLWDIDNIHTSTIDEEIHDDDDDDDDDIPNWLDLNQDHPAVAQSEQNHPWKSNRWMIYVSISIFIVLGIIAIVSTILVTKMNTHRHEEPSSFCYLPMKEMVQCQFDILEVPSCANMTFQQLTIDLLDENYTHVYPCDARHFGLVAVAVAQVNEVDPMDNIFQYWIMAIIYFSLGGQDWRIDRNWLSGKSPCHADWYGVSCSKDNDVVGIELMSNNVIGSFPIEIAELTSIRILKFDFGNISGPLFSDIGRLRNLSILDLESSRLSGTIPTEIGLCENLEFLNLEFVELTGTIPTEIGNLSKLSKSNEILKCLSQSFSDVVCEAFLGLPSRVEGLLPTEIGLLSSLRDLHLIDMMNIQGGLPSQYVHLSNLSVLTISNSFDQEIFFSSLLSRFPLTLEYLTIGGSFVMGQIPTDISSFQSLISLNILELMLTGTLPSEIGLMTKLQSLKIQSTFLTGNIPSEIGNLTHLTCLYLGRNNFADVLPSKMSQLTNLNSNIFKQGC
jgi:hypothetical protein